MKGYTRVQENGVEMLFKGKPEPFAGRDLFGTLKTIVPDTGMIREERGIGDLVFLGCNNLISVSISRFAFIGSSAFLACHGLKHVCLPEDLRIIFTCAFMKCFRLKELHIPSRVELIDPGIVGECIGLEKLSVGKDNRRYCSPEGSNCIMTRYDALFAPFGKKKPLLWGKKLLAGCKKSRIPEDTVIIEQHAFFGIEFQNDTLILPDSVRAIDAYAFKECPGLRCIIGKNVIFAAENCAEKDVILEFHKDCRFLDIDLLRI